MAKMTSWERLYPRLLALGWTDAAADLPGGLRSPNDAMVISQAIDDPECLRKLIQSLERSVQSNTEHQQAGYGTVNVNEVLADFKQAIELLQELANEGSGSGSS